MCILKIGELSLLLHRGRKKKNRKKEKEEKL